MSGCCGIKPAKHRLSGVRKAPSLPHGAQTALSSVPGVLARNADDIALLYEGVLTERGIAIMRQFDPYQLPLLWDNSKYQSKISLRTCFDAVCFVQWIYMLAIDRSLSDR